MLKNKSSQGPWILAPPDLPQPSVLAGTRLGELEHNAVYRVLIFQDHRLHRNRVGLVIAYTLGWLVFGTIYFQWVLHLKFGIALGYTVGITTVILLTLGNLFIVGGIEGYETNGWLKPYFRDLILSGVPGEEIARGIVGKTLVHYNFRLIRFGLICAFALLLGTGAYIETHLGAPLVNWILMAGTFCAFHLWALLNSLGTITIPGTLLWYRGVRQSYERRLKSPQFTLASIVSFNRTILLLALSVCAFFIPPISYLYAGVHVASWYQTIRDREIRMAILAGSASCIGFLGFTVGWLWGVLARRAYPRNFAQLAGELEQLFKLRATYIHEHGEGSGSALEG